MKKRDFNLYEYIVLIFVLIPAILDIFWDFLISFFEIVLFCNNFANPYNFVRFLTSNTTILCSIAWINKLLLLIIGFIPTIILYLACREIKIPTWLNILFSVLLYYLVLQLFASLIFWIFIGLLILSYIIFKLVIGVRKKRVKNEEKIQ